jgi:uncharacterized protein (DUF488 family)
MQIFSIGYERRAVSDFCRTLVGAKVDLLIDVRAAAWSQRPEYRKTALQTALQESGLEYYHCKAAGNPFRPKPGEVVSWLDCGARFAGHLNNHPEIVAQIWALAKGRKVALFCYEGKRDSCHRSVILAAMAKEQPSLRVVDL